MYTFTEDELMLLQDGLTSLLTWLVSEGSSYAEVRPVELLLEKLEEQ